MVNDIHHPPCYRTEGQTIWKWATQHKKGPSVDKNTLTGSIELTFAAFEPVSEPANIAKRESAKKLHSMFTKKIGSSILKSFSANGLLWPIRIK